MSITSAWDFEPQPQTIEVFQISCRSPQTPVQKKEEEKNKCSCLFSIYSQTYATSFDLCMDRPWGFNAVMILLISRVFVCSCSVGISFKVKRQWVKTLVPR